MKKRIISVFILLVTLFGSLVSASLAWFANFFIVQTEGNDEFSGSSIAAYFAGGTGQETDPYIINDADHIYNLAWLQNSDAFKDKVFYFKVCDVVKGENGEVTYLPTQIKMQGQIDGDTNISGAIPPIGTTENPFRGYFDGCGSTISNLWVSTDENDWKERPALSENYVSEHVGLFGAIDQTAIVEDFVLDTVEIKSHLPDVKIGIICGYVDAMLKNVGVYNGIINVSDGSCTSNYSLIGEKSTRIYWEDMPTIDSEFQEIIGGDGTGSQGGDLVVDPNQYVPNPEDETELIPSYKRTDTTFLAAGVTQPISGAVDGTAYYSGVISSVGGKISTKAMYDMTTYLVDGKYTEFEVTEESSAAKKLIGEMFDSYEAGHTLIKITAPFNSDETLKNDMVRIYDKDGNAIKYDEENDLLIPQSCIWFKPMNSGTVSMAFAAGDQGGGDRYAMLYACERNAYNQITIHHTVEYPLTKKVTGNGQLAYYEYEITPEEYDEKYEYLIAASYKRSSTDFGFYALTLAGTNESGGNNNQEIVQRPTEEGEFAEIMYDVDYVIDPATEVWADSYENHTTLLKINSATKGNMIYYLAAGDLNDSLVYYYRTSGVDMQDIAKRDLIQSQEADSKTAVLPNDARFKDRKQNPD